MPFTGRIEEIWAEFNREHLTIWKPGDVAPRRVEVPEGASWELHIVTTARWPEQGAAWATAVTFINDKTGAQAKLCGEVCDYEFSLPMGRMPATDFNIGRVRFWRNRARTNVPPPEEDR